MPANVPAPLTVSETSTTSSWVAVLGVGPCRPISVATTCTAVTGTRTSDAVPTTRVKRARYTPPAARYTEATRSGTRGTGRGAPEVTNRAS